MSARRWPGMAAVLPRPAMPSTAPLDPDQLRNLLPSVGGAGLASSAVAPRVPRGRILKLKLGFNPNSSSVGTTVVVFLWSLVASGAVLAFTSALLADRLTRRRGAPAGKPQEQTERASAGAGDRDVPRGGA